MRPHWCAKAFNNYMIICAIASILNWSIMALSQLSVRISMPNIEAITSAALTVLTAITASIESSAKSDDLQYITLHYKASQSLQWVRIVSNLMIRINQQNVYKTQIKIDSQKHFYRLSLWGTQNIANLMSDNGTYSAFAAIGWTLH